MLDNRDYKGFKRETLSPDRPLRILVVDDYSDNADSMAMLMRFYGHDVETAYGGEEALKVAWANPPDVVLLDIAMPGMSGYEVARHLYRMFRDKVHLFAITAGGSDDDYQNSLEAGFDRHFVKPADPEQVRSAIQELACSH